MAANTALAARVRAALEPDLSFVEKKMFGGIAFMIRRKMCITVGRDRCMFRIDPSIHDELVGNGRCQTVVMKGRALKGYVHVDAAAVKSVRQLTYWIDLALDYNRRLAASK